MTSGPVSRERELEGASMRPSDAGSRWERTQALLHEMVARAPADRARFLEAVCDDPALRREVEELVAAHEAPGPLDELASSVMTPLRHGRRATTAGAAMAPLTAAAADPADSLELARYTILERLGGGGMGVVFRARDTRLGRDVALKFLSPQLSADETAKQRFMVEARATAALEHPNICTIHEVGETADGQLYIVMACYDGETLDRVIARGPLALDAALRIAEAIARGLAQAHERGIVHRDIKPANVMVTGDGLVKVLDFGIAKLSDATVTLTGGAIGTAAYMSPEQAFGEPVDQRTDLWSLGVVLYEMLAGARPFQGANQHALLHAIIACDPAPLSTRRSDAPPELDALLARTLARQPGDRYASAHAVLRDLAQIASALRERPATGTARSHPAAAALADTPLSRSGERRRVTVVTTVTHEYGD
ncbi:MAG TPA: serine/threonine-protein kinase, partial [Gemmatimonadaceae bacterium]|nr:serine/threonine-protein kinase [Gemmatimonadaceae bacterium]